MEIKIGITDIPREVVIDTETPAEQLEQELRIALADANGLFTVTDAKGRKVLVPSRGIAYVDLGQQNARQVGFGTL